MFWTMYCCRDSEVAVLLHKVIVFSVLFMVHMDLYSERIKYDPEIVQNFTFLMLIWFKSFV